MITIDVEKITDTNFNLKWKNEPVVDYEKLIDNFILLAKNKKSIAFVLGSFAKEYPHLVKKLFDAGVEIASHGYNHTLVYNLTFEEWSDDIIESKRVLESIIGCEVKGYRSPSWSLPFEKRYYTQLAKTGYSYSSSYFPMKTYMYGNSINKKQPFKLYTPYGAITEYPIVKGIIPFSGGFYLRVLPLFFLHFCFVRVKDPIIYIHPYELLDTNLMLYFKKYLFINIDFFLAFYSSSQPKNKIGKIVNVK